MSLNFVKVHGTQLLAGDSRALYRQKLARITLDSMVQFVGLLDADGTVLEINQVALDGGGLELADVEGRPFWTTFWWQVSSDINSLLKEMIARAARGEFVRWDTEIHGRAGGTETIVIDASLCPVRDEHGEVVFIAAEGRDITEKKAYEREIARQREELARLDELKTQFFANISHEFRTPLTLMLGPLEDATADALEPLGAIQRERIAIIQRNGLRMLKLVNALLDFSRVEAGRMQAAYQPTDLAALTHDLASSFRATCDKAGLALTITSAPLREAVFVDHEMWEKIVLNLVSNAFKFTLAGGIKVETCEEDGHAVLHVSDTGIGIAAAELPHIFDRFHRVEGARGRTHEGTGIGLALVRELIGLHGGAISVESVLEAGTRFTARLPFGRAHLPQNRIDPPRTQASTATRADAFVSEALRWLPDSPDLDGTDAADDSPAVLEDAVAKPRLLLADDNADMRDYLCRLLSQRYDVVTAADGEEAFAAARRQRPALILTDVMMPRLDGFGLLQKLRADAELRRVPVIVLSARAGEEAKIEGLRRGADDYLVKPFSARELRARVAANIELSQTRAQTERVLYEETEILELLNQVGTAVAAELELEQAVQVVTDAATRLSRASFGAFFYNVIDENGEAYTLYTLSGVSREAFARFPMPRNTAVFGPTFRGEGVMRSDDITQDPRYGRNSPYRGMPAGHLPVRSYLAVSVRSRAGEVLGGLFFGHPEVGVFTEREERIVSAIAVQAGIAIDKARLYRAAQEEIAHRRIVEAALRESEQTLETKVAARTEELLAANERLRSEAAEREAVEEQLRQAQKMEAVGQLTGGLAHDFNNLLAAISGSIDLLGERAAQGRIGDFERYLATARTATKRAAALTHRLLAFSRRQTLDPRPVNINRLVSGMEELIRRTVGPQIDVETVGAGGLWPTLADAGQLENSLLNLCINARDAMPDGGRLTIETGNRWIDSRAAREHGLESGQYVSLCVSDAGCGMPADVIARAFDPFFTTKPIGSGTGLGLSMVYGFAKQSGGQVRIYSEMGEGAMVCIYLPRLAGDGEHKDLAAEPSAPSIRSGTGERVLVVDDESMVRMLIADVLTELGYEAIEAQDGPSALKILDTDIRLDLLITDVGLPNGMNGRQVADAARSRRPDLKVLFVTGYAENAAIGNGYLDAGMHVLTKPFPMEELGRRIREIIAS